jgi:hypothetical protein
VSPGEPSLCPRRIVPSNNKLPDARLRRAAGVACQLSPSRPVAACPSATVVPPVGRSRIGTEYHLLG